MRIALLGDSHGFVPALDTGLAACRAAGPDLVIFLGDALTCPYSPDPPAESSALLRDAGIPVLLGNHELLLRAYATDEWDAAMALRAVRATTIRMPRWQRHMPAGKARLTSDHLAWLDALPGELSLEHVYASHGLPGNPFLSVDGIDTRETELGHIREDAFARPEVQAAEIVVGAHNHLPLTTVRGRQLVDSAVTASGWGEQRGRHLIVRTAAASGWGDQRGREERFGGYAVITQRTPTWEVEHRLFNWRPRDPAWSWDATVAADPPR